MVCLVLASSAATTGAAATAAATGAAATAASMWSSRRWSGYCMQLVVEDEDIKRCVHVGYFTLVVLFGSILIKLYAVPDSGADAENQLHQSMQEPKLEKDSVAACSCCSGCWDTAAAGVANFDGTSRFFDTDRPNKSNSRIKCNYFPSLNRCVWRHCIMTSSTHDVISVKFECFVAGIGANRAAHI